MSIRVTRKNGRVTHINASGSDANRLFIAMAPEAQLMEWEKNQTGNEEFRQMVKEAIAARASEGQP